MRGKDVARRRLARLSLGLGLAGALPAPRLSRLGRAADGAQDAPDLSFFLSQMEGENGAEAQAFLSESGPDFKLWGQLDAKERPEVGWAADRAATDFLHLSEFAPGEGEFRIRANHVLKLAQLNGFPIGPLASWGKGPDQAYGVPLRNGERAAWPASGPVLLFGLRACTLVSRPGEPMQELVLKEGRPNHQSFQCTMGMLRQDGSLLGFPASTVPNADYMFVQTKLPTGRYANLLPTGLHWYRIGTHKPTSPHPHQGALVQQRPVVALRSRKLDANTLQFRATDDWDGPVVPFDNIHVAFGDENRRYPLKFDSAGCQVIPGMLRDGTFSGLWREFARAVGSLDASYTPDPQRNGNGPYAYMLMTGREARLLATGTPEEKLKRLRYGAVGPAVAALRKALRLPDGDLFDAGVQKRFIEWQQQQAPRASAILSLDEAADLKVTL